MNEPILDLMWKAIAASPYLMVRRNDGNDLAEPLVAQLDPDAHGKFWFFTTKDNRIAAGGPAIANFVAQDHHLFCSISGTLTRESDKAAIDKHWSETISSWYDKGRDDPNMLMMRFELDLAEIWHPDNSLKGLFRLMSGKGEETREMGVHEVIRLG